VLPAQRQRTKQDQMHKVKREAVSKTKDGQTTSVATISG